MKQKTIIIIFVSLVLVAIIGYLLYKFVFKKGKSKSEDTAKKAQEAGDPTAGIGKELLQFIEGKTRKNGEKGLPQWSYDGIDKDIAGGTPLIEAVSKQFSFLQHGSTVKDIKEEETFTEQDSKDIWAKYYGLKKSSQLSKF
jgi:hypothetical protein